jgi:RNA polymerase sigma-B factor
VAEPADPRDGPQSRAARRVVGKSRAVSELLAPAVPPPRRIPLDDSRLLAQYAATKDRRLGDALVERFMPLARSIARRYARSNEPLDDLVQVASMGLLNALERFDPERGIAFSTFAVPTIAGEVRRHFRDRCWTVRPPSAIAETVGQVDRKTEELTSRLGRSPTIREVGQALELTDEAVLEARHARLELAVASLNEPPRGRGDTDGSMGDLLGAEDPGYERAQQRATLRTLTEVLTQQERQVLELRFTHDLTQQEIGELIGVSQMQVSRLVRRSLSKLTAVARA